MPAPLRACWLKSSGDGSTVTSGELLARIDTAGKAAAAATAPPPPRARRPGRRCRAAAAAPASTSAAGVASPAAAKILAEKGVDAAAVAGTGRDGRVTKGDALAASAAAPARPPPLRSRPRRCRWTAVRNSACR